MMTTVKFDLPGVGEWADGENMAINLRGASGGNASSVPVGLPGKLTDDAGAACALMESGAVLTVGPDLRTLSLDGAEAGRLAAPFLSLLTEGEGDEALIFTSEGPEWFAGGSCQGAAPADLDVKIESEPTGDTFSATIVCPELEGPYNRMSGELTAADRRTAAAVMAEALAAARVQARARGQFTGPCVVEWRLVDSDGRTIAAGAPQKVGTAPALPTLHFTATKSGTHFRVDTTDTLSLAGQRLRLRVGRTASEFWRLRGARIEVRVLSDCVELSGVTGRLTELGATTSTLSLTPLLAETDGRGETLGASVGNPLEGTDSVLALTAEAGWSGSRASGEPLRASVAFRSGSLTAYAIAGRQGVLAVASSADPLVLRAEARVCRGKIVRICAPAGNGGGWNYGRHHLLVFSTDGISTVSVDGRMQTVSSACIHDGGISRPDAVAAAPGALYVATSAGLLLRLKGSKAEQLCLPFAALAAGRVDAFDELLILCRDGRVFALDAKERLCMRTSVAVRRFEGCGLAVDASGALRDLDREEPGNVAVGWCRRFAPPASGALSHRVEWRLDSSGATDLDLSLSVDSGGGRQRVVALRVNGEINAPLRADFRQPRRPWLTAQLGGIVSSSATRLYSFLLRPLRG